MRSTASPAVFRKSAGFVVLVFIPFDNIGLSFHKVCYQNMYGIMPLQQHGASYPYASINKQGNTAVKDYWMAVGLMLAGSKANGWSQNANGYDSPKSDSDRPNARYDRSSLRLLVWLK